MIHIGDGDVGSRSMWEYKEIGGGWRNVRSVGLQVLIVGLLG